MTTRASLFWSVPPGVWYVWSWWVPIPRREGVQINPKNESAQQDMRVAVLFKVGPSYFGALKGSQQKRNNVWGSPKMPHVRTCACIHVNVHVYALNVHTVHVSVHT